jgi:hypothetical protein
VINPSYPIALSGTRRITGGVVRAQGQRKVSRSNSLDTGSSDVYAHEKGGLVMGDTGKKDKGKREQQKKAKLTPKEKRQQKKDKKNRL